MIDNIMKTTTHFSARRLVMTLLALLCTTVTSWAQLNGEGTKASPYLINNEDDWTTFTSNINSGVDATAYYKLTRDITLGNDINPITTVVGDVKNKPFSGTFDGDYHTIHINMYRETAYAALFGVTVGATIKNLKVDGTINTSNKFAGAFLAYNNGSTTKITNCISSVHIICDNIVTVDPNKPYDCTHGGFAGQNESGSLRFENCIFDGSITDSKKVKTANKCTGFVGWVNNQVYYTNCTMAGVIDVKPNDESLNNSIATFHRLAKTAKANFEGDSYYVIDYTYSGLPVQGVPALTEAPKNTISRVYIEDRCNYYVPGAEISNDKVTYYGWTLTQGTDYLINIVSTSADNKMVYKGINEYGGSFSKDVDPTYQLNVTTWDASAKTGWHAISSPVDHQTFATTNHLTLAEKHNIYRYDESKRQWQEYRNEANIFNEFENSRGYIYRTEENGGNIGFNGTVNTGNVDCELSYTEKSDNLAGFNLIGNPYMHDIYKSVAIPNEKLSDGYCILTVEGTWEYKTDDIAIPAGTAIMVQANEQTKGDYIITLTDTDMAPASKDSNNEIWFTVKNNEYSDVAHVEFKKGNGFNKMPHYNDVAPMLYINKEGKGFASANMNDDVKLINLSLEVKQMSRYTLSFKANGNFNYLHLIDRMTGNDIDMLIEDEYSFVSSSSDNADRFIVKLSNDVTSTGSMSDSFAWQNGSEIIIDGQGQLQIFDITGRMLSTMTINGQQSIDALSTGIYVFRMIGETIKTQKIIVK